MDPPAGWMSCSELAAHFQVNGELLRPRLKRLMASDHTSFREVQNPAAHKPRYLYAVEKILPIIDAMCTKSQTRAGANVCTSQLRLL
jgi:hypothetical protein